MNTLTTPKPLSAVQDFLASPQKLLIDGKRVDSASGETFEVLDPSNNNILTHAPKGDKEDIDRAVSTDDGQGPQPLRDDPAARAPPSRSLGLPGLFSTHCNHLQLLTVQL